MNAADPELPAEIGQRIRDCRERRGMSCSDVCLVSGVHVNSLMNWELGHSLPRVDLLARVVAVIDADLHWLITGDAWEPADAEQVPPAKKEDPKNEG